MTAPSAPTILARNDGTAIYVRWKPVDTATDYNLYVSEAGGAFGVQAQFDDTDVEDDGWFLAVEAPFAGPVSTRLTALNAGAEESTPSNTVTMNLTGGRMTHPTAALRHVMKGA